VNLCSLEFFDELVISRLFFDRLEYGSKAAGKSRAGRLLDVLVAFRLQKNKRNYKILSTIG
jgi:hypothetical protein